MPSVAFNGNENKNSKLLHSRRSPRTRKVPRKGSPSSQAQGPISWTRPNQAYVLHIFGLPPHTFQARYLPIPVDRESLPEIEIMVISCFFGCPDDV
jgi:hypothetical protein